MSKNIKNLNFVYLVIFQMYDFEGNGSVCSEDLLDILTLMIGGNVTNDHLISIAQRMLREADLVS